MNLGDQDLRNRVLLWRCCLDSGLPSEKKSYYFFFDQASFFAIVHLYLVEDESPTTKTTDHNSHCKALHVTKSMSFKSHKTCKRNPPYDSETISCRWSWWEWVRCPARRPRWTRRWKPPKEDPLQRDCPNVPKKIVHNYYHLQSEVSESSAKWEDGTAGKHCRPWSSPTHEEPGERHCNPLGHSLGQVGII